MRQALFSGLPEPAELLLGLLKDTPGTQPVGTEGDERALSRRRGYYVSGRVVAP